MRYDADEIIGLILASALAISVVIETIAINKGGF